MKTEEERGEAPYKAVCDARRHQAKDLRGVGC
jgi:hypothetical protein